MNLYPTTLKDALEEIDIIQEWVDIIQEKFIHDEFDRTKIKVNYQWGFFVERKGVDYLTFYKTLYKEYETLEYPERLEEELRKLRVNISFEYKKKFAMITRLDTIPNEIELIVGEITKIKMLTECKEHGNKNVLDSIPEINGEIIGYDEILFDEVIEEEFDVDEILDKISEHGIESLTENEKSFLENLSDED